MGRDTFSKNDYKVAVKKLLPDSGPVTSRGRDEVRSTGKLNSLVDPAGYDVIRRSLPRMRRRLTGDFELSVGVPIPIEIRLDTTGSMGNNVEKAMKDLPKTFGLCSNFLTEFDTQMAIGIFGDCVDDFVLCRPQFEMVAEKLVHQLTLMVPEGLGGGNGGEDPQYGLFGAAYLTAAYIDRIGLKGYDFTISDEPARSTLSKRQLERIFGNEVIEKVSSNGFEFNDNMLKTETVFKSLLDRAHAFFLLVDGYERHAAHNFWLDLYGHDRVVVLQHIETLPYVQAVIVGLTEGVLNLIDTQDFLLENGIDRLIADEIVRSVSNIPIGAQAELRSKMEKQLPQKGDVFKEKTDAWPMNKDEIKPESGGMHWL